MKFLRNLLATLVGLTIFSVLSFLLLLSVISGLEAEQEVEVLPNSILHLTLKNPISERSVQDPWGGYNFGEGSSTGILDLLDAIDYARTDDRISGIYLEPPYLRAGFSQAEELREALKDFKTSGKFVVAYTDRMSEGSYYVCSVADSIFLHPEGDLEFNGIAYTSSFFKGALDKLGIEAQVFKVGAYKSAIEPFVRANMSEENREQVASFINDVYDNLLRAIADSRALGFDEVKDISSTMAVRHVRDAQELGLIDGLKYYDEMQAALQAISGQEEPELVSFNSYRKSYSRSVSSKNKIAVIVASGDIVNGEAESSFIGADTFIKEIQYARESSGIKAIVLRVNSPGGDFLASDKLWREVTLARKEKPVIVSMSSYAASGGYYMAMGADEIVANANTITGSIGIFSIIFNISPFLEDKLGITTDVVRTGEFSDILTATRPLTDYEKSILQNSAQNGYDVFVAKAAEGRGMEVAGIEAIASGRVWTGTQALENGLVDSIGTFYDAVAIAAEKAGVSDDYRLRYYPAQKSVVEQLMSDLGMEARVKISQWQAGELFPYFQLIEKIKTYKGTQARMSWEGEFQF